MTSVALTEWQRLGPSEQETLRHRSLSAQARELARRLGDGRALEVTELRDGLSLRSSSFVGRVRFDDLTITIRPKLAPRVLLRLFRYAYGLRDLELIDPTVEGETGDLLHDLLIAQLRAEARELLERGLVRHYVRHHEWLGSPRGRVDMPALARAGGLWQAALPCHHHPRSTDFILHQVLASGLFLAAQIASDRVLRGTVARLAKDYAERAGPVPLSESVLGEATRAINRLTSAYEPAIRLVILLYRAQGLLLDDAPRSAVHLPGFLFDMNRFFQALVARLLRDHLPDHDVEEEKSLRDMIQFVPGRNPRGRAAPRPRPDFVVRRRTRLVALLDAKYRDLWERSLPREMLYQLGIYALSQPLGGKAAIIYPTASAEAREATLALNEPLEGRTRAYVELRPLDLAGLADALERRDRGACEGMARRVAFGAEGPAGVLRSVAG
ncbi:MAG: hypothetical protein R3B72_38070 [Polyangiaceae bacterium]